jgi:hypothetical protein
VQERPAIPPHSGFPLKTGKNTGKTPKGVCHVGPRHLPCSEEIPGDSLAGHLQINRELQGNIREF